jgi:hypothetical protein
MIALAVTAALALQSLPPCGTSSPYDEAWSVSSAAGGYVLCSEPASARDLTSRSYRLEREGEVVWRRSLPGGPELGAVSARGWAAVLLRPASERDEPRLVVVDPQGAVAFERNLRPARMECLDRSCPPLFGNPVETVLISDAAGIVFVRRANETYERYVLDDGRELVTRNLPGRIWPSPHRATFLEAFAVEGAPFIVVHLLSGENGVVRSYYVLLDADLVTHAHVVVERGKASWTTYRAMISDAEQGLDMLRVDGISQFSVRGPFGWTSYRIERATQRQHAIVCEGAAPEAVGR